MAGDVTKCPRSYALVGSICAINLDANPVSICLQGRMGARRGQPSLGPERHLLRGDNTVDEVAEHVGHVCMHCSVEALPTAMDGLGARELGLHGHSLAAPKRNRTR